MARSLQPGALVRDAELAAPVDPSGVVTVADLLGRQVVEDPLDRFEAEEVVVGYRWIDSCHGWVRGIVGVPVDQGLIRQSQFIRHCILYGGLYSVVEW